MRPPDGPKVARIGGMEKTLKVLNELEEHRVIERYAIGGGIAATFHAEPMLTYDLDAFVLLPQASGKIISLSPIYEYLRAKGFPVHREHIMIHGLPVQFIPAYNALVEEAVRTAQAVSYRKVRTRIVKAEHLVAVFLQANRPKDRTRVVLLLEEAEIDRKELQAILKRHGLMSRWKEFSGENR
jgi:hypothetical protein